VSDLLRCCIALANTIVSVPDEPLPVPRRFIPRETHPESHGVRLGRTSG